MCVCCLFRCDNVVVGMSGSPIIMRDDDGQVWLSAIHTQAHQVDGIIPVNSAVLLTGPNLDFVGQNAA